MFRIPIFMIFIPYVIRVFIEKGKLHESFYLSNIILISISITTIFAMVFNDLFFNLIEYLGIKKHY